MYRQYVKQAFASLWENPLASFLTILGTALSVAMIMVLVLVYQVKTSSFSPVSERHRMLYIPIIEGLNSDRAGFGGGGLGIRIIRECFYPMTTPEAITAVSNQVVQRRTSVPGVKLVRECDVRQTDAAFWKVFDFRFISGAPITEEIFRSAIPAAIINDRVARQFFGTTDVVGQTLQLDFIDFTIHGVVHSVSEAVTEAYGEIWIPYSLNKTLLQGDMAEGIGGQLELCILARSSADFDAIRQEAQNRITAFNAGQKEFKANIWKQPITSVQKLFYFIQGDRMHGNFSGMLALAALFLFLPVFNLLSIIISQIQKRRAEIGIRKAFGATNTTITRQILIENLLITCIGSLIGLCLSVLFFYIAKDSLLERNDINLQLHMVVKPSLFLFTVAVCLVINLLSAGIPAWRASRAEVADSLHSNI
ncbi:ABC transporter permease [Parabacteroides sp. OttesenSCG-928-O15]|nr:ABC transporter permease [Parabacteroides sp. OttesenSCG-928-O15]